VAMVLAAAVACGGPPEAKFVNVQPGPMPADQTWAGVYYNPVYGYLHIVEKDGNVAGRWKRTDGSHWGEMSGTTSGKVLNFTWKEHAYGGIGPSADSHGSGVFVYKAGEGNVPAELAGQYALAESDAIGDWHCVKQVGMKPDPNSINGDNPADAPAAQDKWK
jgi:hypothetical protein